MVTQADIGKRCLLKLEVELPTGQQVWMWENPKPPVLIAHINEADGAVHIKFRDGAIMCVKIEHVRALDPVHYTEWVE